MDLELAAAVYEEVARKYAGDPVDRIRIYALRSLVNLIYVRSWQRRREAGLRAADRAVENFGGEEGAKFRVEVARALERKGGVLAGLGRNPEAIESYDGVIGRIGQPDTPGLRHVLVASMVEKAKLLHLMERRQEAAVLCDEVLERFGTTDDREVALQVAYARFERARIIALATSGASADALDEVIELCGEAEDVRVRVVAAQAMCEKAAWARRQLRPDEANEILDRTIERFSKDESASRFLVPLFHAYAERAIVQARRGAVEAAVSDWTNARRQPHWKQSSYATRFPEALLDCGDRMARNGDKEAALRAYAAVEELFADHPDPAVAELVRRARDRKANTSSAEAPPRVEGESNR